MSVPVSDQHTPSSTRSPFATPTNPDLEAECAEVGGATRPVPSGLAQHAEVKILWGDQVVRVAHVPLGRGFVVGEVATGAHPVDFHLAADAFGAESWPLLTGGGGAFRVQVPGVSVGFVNQAGNEACGGSLRGSCADLWSQLDHSEVATEARSVLLHVGTCVTLSCGDLTFEISGVTLGAGRFREGRWLGEPTALVYFAGSLVAAGALLGSAAFFVPPLGLTDGEAVMADNRILIQQLLAASAEREKKEEHDLADRAAQEATGGTGEAARGDSGSLGKPESRAQGKRYALKKTSEDEPHQTRAALRAEAATFGMLGLLATTSAAEGPESPWGRDRASGLDAVSAQGAMWGDLVGESHGAGGLSLLGVSEGGGLQGDKIGLDTVGTLGHGAGSLNPDDGLGPGGVAASHGRVQSAHRTRVPRVRMSHPDVSGRLPKEIIQRIVRQNFGRFRLCYERGLTTNPNLTGRVTVRFVISPAGTVSMAANGGSTLPDSAVLGCVVRAFYGVTFPKPENGIVTVVYPLSFAPD